GLVLSVGEGAAPVAATSTARAAAERRTARHDRFIDTSQHQAITRGNGTCSIVPHCPARLHAPIGRNPKASRERDLRRKSGETGPAAWLPDTSALRTKHRGGPNDSPEEKEPGPFPRAVLRTLYRLLTSHRTLRDRLGLISNGRLIR